MARYHIRENGEPGVCQAAAGNCPLGGNTPHFSTKEEARQAFEKGQTSFAGTNHTEKQKSAYERRIIKDGQAVVVTLNTPVPEPVFESKMLDVAASKLRKGDVFVVGTSAEKVETVRTGYKNTTVTFGSGKTKAYPLGEKISVGRLIETPESQKAEQDAYDSQQAEIYAKHYTPRRQLAVERISEQVTAGYGISGHHLGDLADAQAEDSVQARFAAYVKRCEDQAEEDGVSLRKDNFYKKLYDDYSARVKEEVLVTATRGNSVSTSEAQNLVDRATLAAQARFLDGHFR